MKFHSNRNDRSWHTAERRFVKALAELGELILALRAAGMPLAQASELAYRTIKRSR
jgi:hypothetical protein